MTTLREANKYTNVPQASGDWSSVFQTDNEFDWDRADAPAPQNVNPYGGSQNQLTTTLSGEYADAALRGAVSNLPAVAAPSSPMIYNPQYLNSSVGTPNAAVNYPVSGSYSWAATWDSQLKSGGKSGVGGGGTGAFGNPYGSVRESKTVYQGTMPTWQAPEYNEKEIAKKRQKLSANAIAALDMKISRELSRYYENPNVRRQVLADTLAGYGIGLGNILAQAEQGAIKEYGEEYNREYQNAVMAFNNAMAKYQSSATQITAQRTVPNEAAYDQVMQGQPVTSTGATGTSGAGTESRSLLRTGPRGRA